MYKLKNAKPYRGIDSAVLQRQASQHTKSLSRSSTKYLDEISNSISPSTRAHSTLLPMVLESLVNGPLVPVYRQHLKVLIAGADTKNQNFFCEFLTLKGCEVTCTSNGYTAIEICKAEDYDILFVDFSITRVDGIAVIKSITDIVQNRLTGRTMKSSSIGSLLRDNDSDHEEFDNIIEVQNREENIELFDEGGDMLSPAKDILRTASSISPTTSSSPSTVPLAQLKSLKARVPSIVGKAGEFNPNILLVGIDSYPSIREEDAVRVGMDIFCPKPFNVDFISNIVSVWRTSATKADAIAAILEVPSLSVEKSEYSSGEDVNNDTTLANALAPCSWALCCCVDWLCCPLFGCCWVCAGCEEQVNT